MVILDVAIAAGSLIAVLPLMVAVLNLLTAGLAIVLALIRLREAIQAKKQEGGKKNSKPVSNDKHSRR